MSSKNLILGLENLIADSALRDKVVGNIGYLCHSASVDKELTHGLIRMKEIFGDRLKKVFGPQHGFVTDVQDNMIETDHFTHPYFNLPVYSLYSETRIPTDEMLEGLNTIVVDLQDVGTRVYTYIATMKLLMEACGRNDIKVVVLDRPNPIGGIAIEGNILEDEYRSFVGQYAIPQRHGLTMGEAAKFAIDYESIECQLDVIPMKNWQRSSYFTDLGRHWVNPSPNLPTPEGTIVFAGTVLYEGTNVSEGRGSTRSLEVVGHPKLEPFKFADHLEKKLKETNLAGFVFRPTSFYPMFQKHAGVTNGGVHIHVTDREKFNSWQVGQFLCRELYHYLGDDFKWCDKPYEYEFERLAIDLINGTDKVRKWVEANGNMDELEKIESTGIQDYLNKRSNILMY